MENEQKRYEDHIAGRNAVTEALKSGRPLDSVLVAKGDRQGMRLHCFCFSNIIMLKRNVMLIKIID